MSRVTLAKKNISSTKKSKVKNAIDCSKLEEKYIIAVCDGIVFYLLGWALTAHAIAYFPKIETNYFSQYKQNNYGRVFKMILNRSLRNTSKLVREVGANILTGVEISVDVSYEKQKANGVMIYIVGSPSLIESIDGKKV